ncbi:MAG: YqeG family HAD IIIA-type phosphatase [Oscillospiraceae bacterium]|jgi:HAD superfamily phosphatase (TIGR01668 family)
MGLFTPTCVFRHITAITLPFLRARGIKALVLDVDNTLTAHGSQELSDEIAAWLQAMREGAIRLMLASNNTKARVAPFAKKLGLPFASFCCKPSPRWLVQARRQWRLPRSAIALVGDQIFTDQLAGSLYGVQVLLVRPMYRDIKPTIRLKRVLEKPFLLRYYKKGGKLL